MPIAGIYHRYKSVAHKIPAVSDILTSSVQINLEVHGLNSSTCIRTLEETRKQTPTEEFMQMQVLLSRFFLLFLFLQLPHVFGCLTLEQEKKIC